MRTPRPAFSESEPSGDVIVVIGVPFLAACVGRSSPSPGAPCPRRATARRLRVGRGQTKAIKNQREQVIGSAQEGKDGVITVSFPGKLSLTFAGNKIQVNVHPSYKGNMCGLCGSNNGQKKGDLAGPQKCIYSKPELVLAAYRVPLASKPCKPLPQHIERQLREQTEQCDKYQEIPTKVIYPANDIIHSLIIINLMTLLHSTIHDCKLASSC